MNNQQHTLKVICLCLLGLNLLQTTLCFYLTDKTPIVVEKSRQDQKFYVGKKQNVEVQRSNIKRLISEYISLRYKWKDELNVNQIAKNITPFVTEGFKRKVTSKLVTLRDKELRGKKVTQRHTKANIVITKDKTIASFDRVLRVNGIPLLVPTQITFRLVRGDVTVWNKLGLYINGIVIHEGV